MLAVPTVIVIAVLLLIASLYVVLLRRIAFDELKRPRSMYTGLGVRIPATLRSDSAWRNAHRAVRQTLIASTVTAVLGAIAALVVLAANRTEAAFVVAVVAAMIVIALGLVATAQARAVARRSVESG